MTSDRRVIIPPAALLAISVVILVAAMLVAGNIDYMLHGAKQEAVSACNSFWRAQLEGQARTDPSIRLQIVLESPKDYELRQTQEDNPVR